MGKDVIIADYSCTSTVCKTLLELIWADPLTRPAVLEIPENRAGSSVHAQWVQTFRQQNQGEFLDPFISQRLPGVAVGRIGVVGFSAGNWGIEQVLANAEEASRIDFAYAVDGLHAREMPDKSVIIPPAWLAFAQQSQTNDKMMLVSFSQIKPPTFPGTQPSAHMLGDQLGAKWLTAGGDVIANLPSLVYPSTAAPETVPIMEYGTVGNLHMVGSWPVGTKGEDAAAHIWQSRQVQAALWTTWVAPRWLGLEPIPLAKMIEDSGVGRISNTARWVTAALGTLAGFGLVRAIR